jgi:hypothetical protein
MLLPHYFIAILLLLISRQLSPLFSLMFSSDMMPMPFFR